MVEIEGELPTAEQIKEATKQLTRRRFIELGAGALGAGGFALFLKSNSLENNSGIKISKKKESTIENLPPRPGKNLIPSFNEGYTLKLDETNEQYKKPFYWSPSNPRESVYRQSLGPYGENCIEVNASTQSKWELDTPIKIKKGKYVVVFNVMVNENSGQDSSGVAPKISIIPFELDSEGNQLPPIYSKEFTNKDNIVNTWAVVQSTPLSIDIDNPLDVFVEVSAVDNKTSGDTVNEHRTVMFGNIGLHRVIEPTDPDYPTGYKTQSI